MKLPPPDDPDFDQVRDLLRAQYAELGPKRPGWVGRLAQRFQPPRGEPEWVVHAVPEVEAPVAAEPPVTAPQDDPAQPPAEPIAEAAPVEDAGPADFERLSALTMALDELSRLPLAELVEAA